MDEAVLSLRTKQRGANGNSPTALPPLRSPSRRVGALSPEQLLAAELGKNRGALGQADAQQQEDSPIAQIELAAERAMRGAKGLRARREERRLKGIRFASQDPKKAFANLGVRDRYEYGMSTYFTHIHGYYRGEKNDISQARAT